MAQGQICNKQQCTSISQCSSNQWQSEALRVMRLAAACRSSTVPIHGSPAS